MNSISLLATILALFVSAATAEVISGNLDLCLSSSDNDNNNANGKTCLDSLNGVMKPSVETFDENETKAFEWHYDNGLLRSAGHGLCLGPTTRVLSTKACKPYDLILQECPPEHRSSYVVEDEMDLSWVLANTREMRFLITPDGRVQSLAYVQNPETGQDETSSHPFCLTMMKTDPDAHELAYLIPCQQDDDEAFEDKHGFDEIPMEPKERSATLYGDVAKQRQVFDVYGTYSESFLMPLQRVWSYKQPVKLAFQIGLPTRSVEGDNAATDSSPSSSGASVDISMLWPVNGGDKASMETVVVDFIDLTESESSGIISFEPFGSNLDGFGYQLEGKMVATLRRSDDGSVLNQASFLVTQTMDFFDSKPKRSYMIFIILLGCFMGCFALSVVAEKICIKKTRPDGDGTNDGKTVCLSVEDDDEEVDAFPLEDVDLEDGANDTIGIICIQKENTDTESSDSDTDIDESRNSTMVTIPSERQP